MASQHVTARTSLSLTLPYSGMAALSNRVMVYEGWVLKKRRKKMQGFARRYFTLYSSGLLVYSFGPEQPIRDQIMLHSAAISTSARTTKDIHIDSNTATFHIKCLNTEDYNSWMTALRKFVVAGAELRRSNSVRLAAARQQGTLKLVRTGVATGALLDEMGRTISELENSILSLKHEVPTKKHSLSRHKNEKDKQHKDSSVFGLFKKGVHHSPPTANEFGVDESAQSSESLQPSYPQILSTLETLKTQHASLVKLQPLVHVDGTPSAHASPLISLPFTAEEEENPPQDCLTHSPSLTPSKRMSIATTGTESLSEWFDASDGMNEGAQEFVLDEQAFGEESEQPSRILTCDSRSSLDHSERSSIDTDIAQYEEPPIHMPSEDSQPDPAASSHLVVRRTQLPAPPVGDEGSLFSILKKNVGKDLATIAVPVTFNEPLSLLQRSAEEFEYYSLLTQAAQSTDAIERMRFVAAFAVSGYAHTRHRSGRKGFNPMLAETFEDVRMKFIAEKVRHNPVEMAYHAEGEHWQLWATASGKTKFWGKSLEIIPLGNTHVQIGNDHFQWKKPSSFMRNLMVGTKYLEHCGKLVIDNTTDNSRCVLDFKQSGYWAASNLVSGTIHDPNGDVVSHLEGKWDEQMSETVDASHLRILWRASPWPKNTHEYYGFTSFGMTLNEITDDIRDYLPPTDSRYRTDIRALEEGDMPLADAEKIRIEELQRERRRTVGEVKPKWFKQIGDEWVYAGGYWETRAKGWKNVKFTQLW